MHARGGRKARGDVLVKQGDELETAKDQLKTGLALAKQVLDNASDVKVLQFERTVVDGLNAATHHGVSLQPQCGASVLFVETAEMKALREMFPLLGYISGSDTNPSACTTEGDGLKEATVGKEAEFVVSAVDFQGKRRTTGGDGSIVATVMFDGQVVRIDTTVFDSGDGAYTLKYTFPEGSPEGACQLDVLILGQHVQESPLHPFAVQVSTERGRQFVHASTFDTNGVLRWIGTGGGTKAYQNPHEKPGGVVGKMSSMYSGCAPSVFVDVGQAGNGNAWSGYNSTSNYPNSWMSVDLGEGRQLAPDYNCVRHGNHADHVLRNWRFEGSNDDKNGTILKTHINDSTLTAPAHSTASWLIQAPVAADDADVAAAGTSYRYFRILQYGKSLDGYDHPMCAGIELCGLLTE